MMNWSSVVTSYLFTYGLPLLRAALVLLIGHFVVAWLADMVERAMKKHGQDPSLTAFLKKAVSIAGHTVLVLSALSSLGVSTTGLVAVFSAAAVAIGVGLKDSLGNVAGGILLLIAPRFATGDYIAACGEEGIVLSVDLLHTTLRTLDNRQVSLPNGTLVAGTIVDYSREAKRRVDLVFPVSYTSDLEAAKKAAIDAAKAHPLVLDDPEGPFARVSDYRDSAVELTVRAWCATADYWTVRFDLTEQVRQAFEQAGVKIPFPQLDVHLVEKN